MTTKIREIIARLDRIDAEQEKMSSFDMSVFQEAADCKYVFRVVTKITLT